MGIGRQVGERDVLGDREVQQQAALLAILRDEVEAAVDGAARLGDLDRVAEQDDFAADGPVDAEDGPRELGASGADQAGQPQDSDADGEGAVRAANVVGADLLRSSATSRGGPAGGM